MMIRSVQFVSRIAPPGVVVPSPRQRMYRVNELFWGNLRGKFEKNEPLSTWRTRRKIKRNAGKISSGALRRA
jgi:hypothetical protein